MGACSSRPKTAEFEGNMNFYIQEEIPRKNLDDDQNNGCDARSKSMEPKTAEFEQSMNFHLQEEMTRKSLEYDQKSGCNAGLKSIEPEQKIFSQCSLQKLQLPGMENEHGGMGVVLLESEKEHLAGSSLENNRKETCARAEGTCHSKHNSVAEGESRVPEIGTDIAKLQNEKISVVQELYEEPALAQKENVLGSLRNSMFEEEVPQKVALKDAENGKFPTVEKTNEDKELVSFEGGKPKIDAEEDNPASGRARQEPFLLASQVPNVDFKLKINSTNCRTENATAGSASRAANGTMLVHNDKRGDFILEKPSKPEGLVYGAQRHDFEKALKEESAPLTNDSEWTNLNCRTTPSNGSLTGSLAVFKVVDMRKEQVIDYERYSAASKPPQTFQELRSIYGRDIASDIDEVLEKLASEFERQESLSSVLP